MVVNATAEVRSVDEVEALLQYYSNFRSQEDQVYPCLEHLSRLTERSIETLYQERKYLPDGKLLHYQRAWMKKSKPSQ